MPLRARGLGRGAGDCGAGRPNGFHAASRPGDRFPLGLFRAPGGRAYSGREPCGGRAGLVEG
jgi:hypothetical protein